MSMSMENGGSDSGWPPADFDVDDLLASASGDGSGLDWTHGGLLSGSSNGGFRLDSAPRASVVAGPGPSSGGSGNGGPMHGMYGSISTGDMDMGAMMNDWAGSMADGHSYGQDGEHGESSSGKLDEGKGAPLREKDEADADGANATSGNSLKRGMACGFCRKRKLRCSGEKPTCSNCIRFRKTCEYAQVVPSKKDPTDLPPATAAGPSTYGGPTGPGPGPGTGPQTATATYPVPHSLDSLEQLASGHMMAPNFNAGPLYFDPQGGTNTYGWSSTTSIASLYPQNVVSDPYAPPSQLDLSFPPTTFMDPHLTPTSAPAGPFSHPQGHGHGQYLPVTPTAPSTLPYMHQIPPTLPSAPNPGLYGENYPLSSQPLSSQPSSTPSTMSSRPTAPMRKISSLSPATAGRSSTPEDPTAPAPPSSTLDPRSPAPYASPPPLVSALYGPSPLNQSHIDPIEGITERLGEFLFSPLADMPKEAEPNFPKRVKTKVGESAKRPSAASDTNATGTLWRPEQEFDGLSNTARTMLLDTFLAHSRLFFEMSVPRFRYRMTFTDRRRPSLALLYTMYLWGARMSGNPAHIAMEPNFYHAACQSLDAQTSSADRLLDATRCAMLLSAYAYSSGRYHEGWLLAGVASRVVLSTGIHQIGTCVFKPAPPRNPLLRNKVFLLPPAEDALELAERIHTFWAVYAIERCGAIATSFPSCLRDEDITTPFPRPLADIASGNVTHHDDLTVRDFYQQSFIEVNDSHYARWIKGVTLLERASKLAFRDPEEGSEFSNAWATYSITLLHNPATPAPPPWLDQPKYRCPKEYRATKLGLDLFIESMGVEGIFPVDRKRNAEIDAASEPFIPSSTVIVHHQLAAVFMLLHDINSLDCENKEAVSGARKSVALMRSLPQLPFQDVDSFIVLVWALIAKTLIKEMHRLKGTTNKAALDLVESDVDVILSEMARIGMTMALARSHHKALQELKSYSPGSTPDGRMGGAF